ncbi:MAG TPA: type II/IV secretion system protein, partial [Candidatus Saccharibacteria bacterium]|nr:type II/IV secretion system protein [Candidatus Saccharibacteria bacterium]
MRLSDSTVEQLLVKRGRITQKQLDKLKDEQKQNNRPLQDLVVRNELISDKELTQVYADFADIPFVEIHPKEVEK